MATVANYMVQIDVVVQQKFIVQKKAFSMREVFVQMKRLCKRSKTRSPNTGKTRKKKPSYMQMVDLYWHMKSVMALIKI